MKQCNVKWVQYERVQRKKSVNMKKDHQKEFNKKKMQHERVPSEKRAP